MRGLDPRIHLFPKKFYEDEFIAGRRAPGIGMN